MQQVKIRQAGTVQMGKLKEAVGKEPAIEKKIRATERRNVKENELKVEVERLRTSVSIREFKIVRKNLAMVEKIKAAMERSFKYKLKR